MARGHYWNDRNWRNRNINKKRFDTTNFIIIILIVILVIFFLNPELIDDLKVKTEIGNDKPLVIDYGDKGKWEIVWNDWYRENPGRFESDVCGKICSEYGGPFSVGIFIDECICDTTNNNPDVNIDKTAEWKRYIEKYGK